MDAGSDDSAQLKHIAEAIYKSARGQARFRQSVPMLIRQAIDEVIDAPRTGRFTIGQLEKTEKTYIGTKVEILLRKFLGFPKGLLDLVIDGRDVDIKNTVTGNWMIPLEAWGKICILVGSDEKTALCRVGLLLIREEYLTAGPNRDSKRSISAAGMRGVHWLLYDAPYPSNFWERQDPAVVRRILGGRNGTECVVMLFRELQRIPISRKVIQTVAPQKDSLKRVRKNGGARDRLAQSNIVLLSGAYHRDLIADLGLAACTREEFISLQLSSEAEKEIVRKYGLL